MKKTYTNMYLFLRALICSIYGWKACGDLKFIGFLLGLQSVFFVNGMAEHKTNITKLWIGPCEKLQSQGGKYVRNRPLIDKGQILLPPPHIKLGLMKNFVKAKSKHGKSFEYLREKFERKFERKI